MQLVMERKLELFGHICRIDDNRLVKNMVFGIIAGLNRRGRPSREWRREWMYDIKEWCRTDAQTLSIMAQDSSEWRRVVMETLETNGRRPWKEEEGVLQTMSAYKPEMRSASIN